MKKCCSLLTIIFLSLQCTKSKVPIPIEPISPIPSNCQLADSISYSQTVSPILNVNCNSCHQYPGSGSISLDSYSNVSIFAKSGQLVQSIIHDTNYVIMPPPPHKGLDSCQIKAIKLWVLQGCQDN